MSKTPRPGRAITGKIEHKDFHPVSYAFPAPTEDLVERLARSILTTAQRMPILLSPDGRIVDGRARYFACAKIGQEPLYQTLSENESLAIVSAEMNGSRRDLTKAQRMQALRELLPYMESEAKERQHKGTKGSQNVGINDTDESGRTRELLSSLLGVSPATVARAKKVIADAIPEINRLMVEDVLTPGLAAQVADLPESVQESIAASENPKEDALEAVHAGREPTEKKLKRVKKKEPKAEQPPEDRTDEEALGQDEWPIDGRGNKLPASIQPIFGTYDALLELKNRADRLRRDIESMGTRPVGAYLSISEISEAMKAVARMIYDSIPYAVCPICGGDMCDACLRQGWVTKSRWVATGNKL